MRTTKFWNCLKAIANMFDFTVMITFTDGHISDFDIKYNNGLMLLEGDVEHEA